MDFYFRWFISGNGGDEKSEKGKEKERKGRIGGGKGMFGDGLTVVNASAAVVLKNIHFREEKSV